MTAKELLLAGADYLETHKWGQGHYFAKDAAGDECACAVGAMAAAARMSPLDERLQPPRTCFQMTLHVPLAQYNDTKGRTKRQVILAMRLAAESCE